MTGGRRWRRAGPAVLLAVLLVLVVLGGVLAMPRTTSGALDPESAEPQGSRALGRVLEQQGVRVVRVETVREATQTAGSAGRATVLVVRSPVLPPDRLAELAAVDADLVLVEPDAPVLAELAPSLQPAGVTGQAVRTAGCADDDAQAAGTALAGGHLVRSTGDAVVCFPDPQDREAGSYAVTTEQGRTVRVIGQSGVLTNEHLGDDGNAALALRALGARPTLVWLMASPLDTSADEDVTATDLLPPGVLWAGGWLVVVAVLAVLWRGRRLGPLVDEPLPVVVRSAETAEGRAGLYRAAGERARAAAVLRAAALRRLAPRLGLPSSAAADDVVAAAARVTGRRADDVRALLLGPPPADGGALVALADDLDRLSSDVLSTDAGDRHQRPDQREAAAL